MTGLPIFLLQDLARLSIADNKLTKLPSDIANLQKLHALILRDNQLTGLPLKINGLVHLSSLYLSSNKIKKIPSAILKLSKLAVLSLYRNQVKELPPQINQLSSLQNLDLHDNQLEILPKEFGLLKNLKKLNLSNNSLKELPKEFCQLSNELELKIDENHILKAPPLDIALQGIEAIKQYFDSQTTATAIDFSKEIKITGKQEIIPAEVSVKKVEIRENQKPTIGVKELAKELAELINHKSENERYNIGILGKWGRGKTFLIEQIKQHFKEKGDPFHIVEFHAWRYQDTPAIWAYLYEKFAESYYNKKLEKPWLWTQKILNFPKKAKKWLYQEKFTYSEYAFLSILFILVVTYIAIKNLYSYLIGTFVILALIKYVFHIKNIKTRKCIQKNLINIRKTFNIKKRDGILYALLHFLPQKNAIALLKKYFSKGSFKELLGIQAEILKELKLLLKAWIPDPKTSKKRILLIVDDIDRCSEDKIIDIVDALRVMLEDEEIYKRVVVISAIDEEILKRAIKIKYKHVFEEDEKQVISEYMDKLFLVSVKLPQLTNEEKLKILDVYTEGKREEKTSEPVLLSESELGGADVLGGAAPHPDNKVQPTKGEPSEETPEENKGNEEQETDTNKHEVLDSEYQELCKNLKGLENATPRKIRIVYYRYLLAKKLLSAELQQTNDWQADSKELKHEIGMLSPYLIQFIIKKTQSSNLKDIETTLNDTQYQTLKKIIDIVVAY